MKAVGDWLGHANPNVTLTTYAHLMPADEEVARAVLDAAFAGSDGQTTDNGRTTALWPAGLSPVSS